MPLPSPKPADHPNAVVALGSGSGLGTLAVWALNKWAHASLDAPEGAAISSALAAAFLVIGRQGLSGFWKLIWKGQPVVQPVVILPPVPGPVPDSAVPPPGV